MFVSPQKLQDVLHNSVPVDVIVKVKERGALALEIGTSWGAGRARQPLDFSFGFFVINFINFKDILLRY